MIRARPHVEVAGGDRAQALRRVQAVDLGVVGVVEEVGAARRQAEADERDEGLEERVALVEHAGRGGRGEHEDVLGPLLRTCGADGRLQRRRATGPWCRGRSRAGRIGGRGHRVRLPVSSAAVRSTALRPRTPVEGAGRRLRRTWLAKIYTRKGDDGTHRSPLRRAGRERLRRPRRVRRGRRSGLDARPRPRRDRAGLRARRAAGAAAARAVRRRRRAGDRAREPCEARTRRLAHDRRRWSTALEPIIDDVTARYEAADRVRAPGREPHRRRARRRAHGRAAGRARSRSRPPATAGSPTASVVPYLNRLADLVYTLARWQEGTFRPVRADRAPERIRPTADPDLRSTPCPSRSPSSPRPPTASRSSCSPCPSGRARRFGPGADVVDAALGGGLAAFLAEAGFEGKLGETLAVPTAGKLRAKAAILVGIGEPAELTRRRPAPRRAPRWPRRASKAASVATTLATRGAAISTSPTPRRRSPRVSCSARTSTSSTRATARRRSLKKVTIIADGGAAVRAAVERGATIGDAVIVGARHGQHAVEGEVTRRHGRGGRAQAPARARRHRAGARRASSSRRRRSAACSASVRVPSRPPRFLKMTYAPAGARGKALALVGKGVVFDSGGLSLKTARRHGDDEDRHVGWRGGDRGDVGAAPTSA